MYGTAQLQGNVCTCLGEMHPESALDTYVQVQVFGVLVGLI